MTRGAPLSCIIPLLMYAEIRVDTVCQRAVGSLRKRKGRVDRGRNAASKGTQTKQKTSNGEMSRDNERIVPTQRKPRQSTAREVKTEEYVETKLDLSHGFKWIVTPSSLLCRESS